MPLDSIMQPPIEDLLNARQIADNWVALVEKTPKEWAQPVTEMGKAFASINRLIGTALEKLAEPHPVTVESALVVMRALTTWGNLSDLREARDCAAVVTRTALTWELPR